MKCGLIHFSQSSMEKGFNIIEKVQEESGFKLNFHYLSTFHRGNKSSIDFCGKAQSLIFQLDIFIKTEQIFYIPAPRSAWTAAGRESRGGHWARTPWRGGDRGQETPH